MRQVASNRRRKLAADLSYRHRGVGFQFCVRFCLTPCRNEADSKSRVVENRGQISYFSPLRNICGGCRRMLRARVECTLRPKLWYTFDRRPPLPGVKNRTIVKITAAYIKAFRHAPGSQTENATQNENNTHIKFFGRVDIAFDFVACDEWLATNRADKRACVGLPPLLPASLAT